MGPNEKSGTYGLDAVGAELTATLKKKPKDGHKDEYIYDLAMAFIEQHKAGPFYLNVWTHITHHTITPQQKFVDEFASVKVNDADFSDYQREKFQTVMENGGDVDDAMRHYLGEAFTMDQDIGRLLAKLDELGLSENTIVVFSSDQGPPAPKNAIPRPAQIAKAKAAGKTLSAENIRLGMRLLGYAGPNTRGGKLGDYQGGLLVPFIVRWPGHVPAGRVDDKSLISGADWLPTICAIAGVKINAADFDGDDASKAFFGGVHERTKPLFWKTNTDKSNPAMRWQNWKFRNPQRARSEAELYDLSNDPGERKNLAAEKPELVKELAAKLKTWTDTLPKTYEHGDSKEEQ
jgi:N-acetylgalactosamine-6-sulfatase